MIIALFLLSLTLLVYDSVPWLHFSVYRPLAIFPLLAASLLLLFTDFRFRPGDGLLVLFVAYSVGHSLVMSVVHGGTGDSVKHSLTLLFGLAAYRTAVYAGAAAQADAGLRKRIAWCLLIGIAPSLAVGLLQAADAYFLRSGASGAVTALFSEKVYRGRIQMLSGEPSWAGIHLLSAGLLLLLLYRRGFRRLLPLLAGVGLLTVLLFSAYTYAVLLIALLIYLLTARGYRIKTLLALAVFALLLGVAVPYLLQALHVSGYFTDRFQFNFSHLLRGDNSVFVRVVFPAIGFMEFTRHPLFGVGGGFYYREFAELLLRHFDYGLKFSEVSDLVNLQPEMASPRNLWSRLFAEEGLVGVLPFGGFMVSTLRRARSSAYAGFAFALCVALVMNFDSWSFVDFWLLIGLLRGGFFESWSAGRAAARERSDTEHEREREWRRFA